MEWLQDNPKILMRNRLEVEQKIQKLVREGPNRVQLIADFDRTLSRTHYHGKQVGTSYCVFEADRTVSKEYQQLALQLKNKYYPIEVDPRLTEEQKIPHMIEWYKKSFAIILDSGVHMDKVPEMVRGANLHLRCRTSECFRFLNGHGVPILVYSAGLGNVIQLSLDQQHALTQNVTVVANFLEYDDRGMPSKFASDTILHMYNKNSAFPPAMAYYSRQENQQRFNAVLIGDSLGDSTMAEGAPYIKPEPLGNSTVLRIGFLNPGHESKLQKYLGAFDIVLMDDQTMDVTINLFKAICNNDIV